MTQLQFVLIMFCAASQSKLVKTVLLLCSLSLIEGVEELQALYISDDAGVEITCTGRGLSSLPEWSINDTTVAAHGATLLRSLGCDESNNREKEINISLVAGVVAGAAGVILLVAAVAAMVVIIRRCLILQAEKAESRFKMKENTAYEIVHI